MIESISVSGKEPIVVCQRRPLLRVCTSAWGVLNILIAPITLGVSLLAIAHMYFWESPAQVWMADGKLHASRKIPVGGICFGAIHLEVLTQTLLFIPVNHCLTVHFQNEKGRKASMGLNQIYYGKTEILRAERIISLAMLAKKQ